MALIVTDTVSIQEWELVETFDRSSGAGGQNVNKVATKVTLRFFAQQSPHLEDSVKARLKKLSGTKWTVDGTIVLQCDETRSQSRNRELAKSKLVELIRQSLVVRKKRRPTKPTFGSVQRRLEGKSNRSELKARRAKIDGRKLS
jgi:ribosome-associated protein